MRIPCLARSTARMQHTTSHRRRSRKSTAFNARQTCSMMQATCRRPAAGRPDDSRRGRTRRPPGEERWTIRASTTRRPTWSTATSRTGARAKPAFIDPDETLTYGELQARANRMANLLATYGIARESRVALLLLDTVDFPRGVLGRDQGRRRAGVPQHAADGRAVRLHPRRQPGEGAVRVGAAAARGAADPRAAAVPQARLRARAARRRRSRCRSAASCGIQSAELRRPPTPAATRPRSGSTRRARPACPRACGTCTRARWRRRG